jgi:GT2 family glycosyltransferase
MTESVATPGHVGPSGTVSAAGVRVSVVIPTFRGGAALRSCLDSLAAQRSAAFDVTVVDDAPDSRTGELVREFPGVQYLPNPRNLGFAAAVNRGIRSTSGGWALVLNDDALVESGTMAAIEGATQSRLDMGACFVRLADRPTVDSAGIIVHPDGSSTERGRNEPVDASRFERPVEVFGPSGSAGVYRRAVFDELGGFDERFFAYYEDVDLAWRARSRGYGCRFLPKARVLHQHSATWGRMSSRKLQLLERNRLWNLWKNYPSRFVIEEPLNRFRQTVRALDRGLDPQARSEIGHASPAMLAWTLARADLEAAAGFDTCWSMRRTISRTARVSPDDLEAWITPGFDDPPVSVSTARSLGV